MTRALTGISRPQMDLAALFARNRALYGDATMTAGGPGDPAPTPPAPAPPAPTPLPGKTFDQAQVDRFTGTARDEGRQAALKELAEELGVPIDEVKATIKADQDRKDAERSEAEKAQRAADAEKTAATSEKAAAAGERHATKVERILLRSGLAIPEGDDVDSDEFVTTAVGLVKATVGADEAAIKTAVEKLKTTMPALFTPGTAAPGGPKGGDPGRGPRGGDTRPGTFGAKGLTEAQRRGWADADGKPIKQPA